MAAVIRNSFSDLRKHVKCVISELLETRPDQAVSIYQEILSFSAELSSIAEYQHQEPNCNPNDKLATVSHGHTIIATANNPTISKLNSTQAQDSLGSLQSQPFPVLIQNRSIFPSTVDEYPEPTESSVEEFSNSTVCKAAQSSSHEGTYGPITRPQSLAPQLPPSQPSPRQPPLSQHPTQQSLPSQLSPAQPSLPSRLPSQTDHSSLSIVYEMQDGVIRLLPTAEEWLDFPKILQYARDLGVEGSGICKVVLPEGVVGVSKPKRYTKRKAFCYSAHSQKNGTFSLERSVRQSVPQITSEPADIPSGTAAVVRFEELLKKPSGFKDVRYCTDMEARTLEDWKSFGLSTCPIWPLKGNGLSKTGMDIPGIHWPYFYEAWDAFGTPFAMHREDGDLHSINYLWVGNKSWTAVPASHINTLEEKSRETNGSYYSYDCAQFLRHSATFYPSSILDHWGIPYKIVIQRAGEVIITFPRVYHQGFSTGYTFAVAANYADEYWSVEGYRGCDSQSCPKGSITKEMLEFQDRAEINHSEKSNDERRVPQSSIKRLKTRACNDNNLASKKRKTLLEKPLQSSSIVHGTDSSKRIKKKSVGQEAPKETPHQSFTNVSMYLKDFEHIFKDASQPANIYRTFTHRSRGGDSDTMWLLTRLFFAAGSPDAFDQLREACSASRQARDFVGSRSNSISEVMQALDRLDVTIITASILRRFYLTLLVSHRNERGRYHQHQRSKRLSNYDYLKNGVDVQTGIEQNYLERADTIALTELMAEAYPNLKPTRKHSAAKNDEYQKKLSSLKTRLRDGRNWHKMQEQFSSGILALIPIHGDYQIHNREVERLPRDLFWLFLDVLTEFRGEFLRAVSKLVSQHIFEILSRADLSRRYIFENEGNYSKQEPLDSNNFIKFCELDS